MKLFDAHTHVQFSDFEKDRHEAIQRALENGVSLVNVGTEKESSKKAVEITNQYNGVYAAVGLHPTETEENFDYEFYKKLALNPKVVAIGECGLDYFRLEIGDQRLVTGIKEKQKEVFLKHMELAQEVNKPLMIHCRPSKGTDDAYEDLLEILRTTRYELRTKIVHFYVGGLETTKKLLEAGCYFTFGGVITFARDYDEVIKYLPLDRILLETDAPYVAPAPYRGKRNEPAYVMEIAKKMAELKDVSLEEIAEITTQNNLQVFRLKNTI